MGSHPWWCSTPYREPLQQTLEELRHHEFLTKVATDSSQYGSKEAIEEGIAEYIEECDADGTCSILDVENIGTTPEDFDFGTACPLEKETLVEIFGTDKPTKAVLDEDSCSEVYELLDRGKAAYIISYDDDKPLEIHFFGMSYD